MPIPDGNNSACEQSARPAQSERVPRIVHPQCVANGAYKCWHPTAAEKSPAAKASGADVERGGHLSWLARLRFSFFHR